VRDTVFDPAHSAAFSSREHSVAQTFVVLADALVDGYDTVDVLDLLVAACVHLLDRSAAGVLLEDQQGAVAVVSSSSERSRLLQATQVQNGEGPSVDCVRTGAAVTSTDLYSDRVRWPSFVPGAVTAGFRCVTAIPLQLRDQTIGALTMYTRTEIAPENVQRVVQAFADVATIGILQRRSSNLSELVVGQLQRAVESRVVIEQAKGVLAERHKLSMDAAFATLRRHARSHNDKLSDVALAVLNGDIDPGAVATSPLVA
jgi:transcriptional regulator with GAF, ATPase, and Fis domain